MKTFMRISLRRLILNVLITAFLTTSCIAQQSDLLVDCQDGWQLIKEDLSCVRIFYGDYTWWSANGICKSYGSELVEIRDRTTAAALFKYYVREHGVRLDNFFRIGMSKEASEAPANWAYNQPEKTDEEFSLTIGGNPGDAEPTWTYRRGDTLLQFICQRPPCVKESFHCMNHICIQPHAVCDGVDDCGDLSDELNCSSSCSWHIKDDHGEINNDMIGSRKLCHWKLESIVGSNIELTVKSYTDISNAHWHTLVVYNVGHDIVKPVTIVNEGSVGRSVYSNFNQLMVRFTDNGHGRGQDVQFNLTWKAIKPKAAVTIQVAETWTELNFSGLYLGGQHYSWTFQAKPLQLVTIMFKHVDIAPSDDITVYDRKSSTNRALLVVTNERWPRYVTTTGNELYIQLNARTIPFPGFIVEHKEGCDVELTKENGVIQSPGYGVTDYPQSHTCTWSIRLTSHKPVTLSFSSQFDIADDKLTVTTDNGTVQVTTAVNDGSVFSRNGHLTVEFVSGTITTAKGFRAYYNADCLRPKFTTHTTITPPVTHYYHRLTLTISCHIGYVFSNEPYNNQPTVTVTCLMGKWSLPNLPQCWPVYCGQPESVVNGYMLESTGVTFDQSVTYACLTGFTMISSATVTCQKSGLWEALPTCQGTKCPMNRTLLSLDNGDVKKSLNITEFASTIHYSCRPGFDLVGAQFLTCLSDGHWSREKPTCQRLQCKVVPGFDNKDYFLDDKLELVCKPGTAPESSTEGICGANQTFEYVPKCVDVDECQENSHKCKTHTGAMCYNAYGYYTCTCPHGYQLDSDNITCSDVLECDGNHYCSQKCVELVGGYRCECDRLGYTLYTQDNIEGYEIPASETGLMPGDTFYINHTCVLRTCDKPATPNNSHILVNKEQYQAFDSVRYICDIGYRLTSGGNNTTCGDNGQWVQQFPLCSRVYCDAETIPSSGLLNPVKDIRPQGAVPYNAHVTMSCIIPGGSTTVVKKRYCTYNMVKKLYEFTGDSFECGFIYCGHPDITGVILPHDFSSLDTRRYGSTFEISCPDEYDLEGKTNLNRTIMCQSNGLWDFGTLECIGKACNDPGRPVGGTQSNATTSYKLGASVSFMCDRDGYMPVPDTPITCLNGTPPTWSSQVPLCKDTEAPEFTNCPQSPLVVPLYSAAMYERIDATDTTGVENVTVSPSHFLPSTQIIQPINVTYTARDYDGNTATCLVQIRVRESNVTAPPVAQCPDSRIVYLTQDPQFVNTHEGVAIDDLTTVYPPPFYITADDRFSTKNVKVTKTDVFGRSNDCFYQLNIRPGKCTEFDRPPEVTCTGNICTATCGTGLADYDSDQSEFNVDCSSEQGWQNVSRCVPDFNYAKYLRVATYEYDLSPALLTRECQTTLINELMLKITEEQKELKFDINRRCHQESTAGMTIVFTGDNYSFINGKFTIDYKLQYNATGIKRANIRSCDSSVAVDLVRGNAQFPNDILKSVTVDANCSMIWVYLNMSMSPSTTFEPICPEGKTRGKDGFVYCLPCPRGSYKLNASCVECVVGSYQDQTGQYECKKCDPDTDTYTEGSTSKSQCIDKCSGGYVSNSGLPPCHGVPKSYYRVNSTSYSKCPVNKGTLTNANVQLNDCVAHCAPGTYSSSGYHACNDCPVNFYQPLYQQTTCKICPNEQYTNGTGKTSLGECMPAGPALCPPSRCNSNGVCQVPYHEPVCVCDQGYTGQWCEARINPCDSNPCFYDAACNTTDGSCSCPKVTEKPTWTVNCPSDKQVSRYHTVNFSMPEARDSRYQDLTVHVFPEGFRSGQTVIETLTVTYKAIDFDGNSAVCSFNVTVVDNPQIKCKDEVMYHVYNTSQRSEFDKMTHLASSSGQVTFNPMSVMVSANNIGVSTSVTAMARNTNDDTVSCKFLVAIRAKVCSAAYLPDPVNGQQKCTRTETGYWCQFTCNPGYMFYMNADKLIRRTCNDTTDIWDNTTSLQCVADNVRPTYLSTIVTRFTNGLFGDCLPKYELELNDILNKNLEKMKQLYLLLVPTSTNMTIVHRGFTVDKNGSYVRATLSTKYLPIETPQDVVKKVYEKHVELINNLLDDFDEVSVIGCNELSRADSEGLSQLSADRVCSYDKMVFDASGNKLCLACPPGTKYSDGQCMDCELNTYQDQEGQTSCTRCDPKRTEGTGSAHFKQCLLGCPRGSKLTGGVVPCELCAEGTYESNGVCLSCGKSDQSTLTKGALSESDCHSPCALGHYSVNGYDTRINRCRPCPHNFYQNVTGQRTCHQCPSGTYTEKEGSTGDSSCLSIIDRCQTDNLCMNRSICSFADHDYHCQCSESSGRHCEITPAYSGPWCEVERDDCVVNRCQHGGMCQDRDRGFHCFCPHGYSGTLCDVEKNLCVPDPCIHGKCESFGKVRRQCVCDQGYTGENCDKIIESCSANTCLHNGTCHNLLNDFRCSCGAEYRGKRCEMRTDLCLSVACGSGSCIDDYPMLNYFCVCEPGYSVGALGSTCTKQDVCLSHKCEHGSVCRPQGGGYDCVCTAGYSGHRCQHDIDNCERVTCENNATCHDLVDNYECRCLPGYEGKHCENNTDECAINPCNSNHTHHCEDSVDSYTCHCEPGYTGQYCQVEINECLSYPCRHSARCEDGLNDFHCDCAPGYTGKQCEVVMSHCEEDTCTTQSNCVDQFNGFLCMCTGGTYGDRCQHNKSACDVLKPCEPYGTCHESDGVASCNCSNIHRTCDFVVLNNQTFGPSQSNPVSARSSRKCKTLCEGDSTCVAYSYDWLRQMCVLHSTRGQLMASQYDLHNMTDCHMRTRSLRGRGCHIQTTPHDGHTCLNGATLEYYEDSSYTCHCRPGYLGSQCETNVDDCPSAACPLNSTCHDMYQTHLCACHVGTDGPECLPDTSNSTDHDLYLFHDSSEASLLAPIPVHRLTAISVTLWVKFVDDDDNGDVLTLYKIIDAHDRYEKITFIKFNRNGIFNNQNKPVCSFIRPIKPHKWYHVIFTWDDEARQSTLIVNTARHCSTTVKPALLDLGRYMSLSLGAGCNTCRSFHGWVSQVSVYSRVLDFSTEVSRFLKKPRTQLEDAQLLLWSATYKSHPFVQFHHTSTARLDAPSTGRSPLRVRSCPSDISKYSSSRLATVSWDEPKFHPSNTHGTPSYRNDDSQLWGRYVVVYTATDKSIYSALCRFVVHVTADQCAANLHPIKGIVESEGSGSKTTYQVSCNNNDVVPFKSPRFYKCGLNGRFYLNERQFRFPPCSSINPVPITTTVTVTLSYRLNSPSVDMVFVENELRNKLKFLSQTWPGLCVDDACTNAEITHENTAIKSLSSQQIFVFTVLLKNVLEKLHNSSGTVLPVADILRLAILDTGIFDSVDIPGHLLKDSHRIVTQIVCDIGEVYVEGSCVKCGQGSRYVDGECELCGVGFYQDTMGQSECNKCPDNTSTQTIGSSSTDCTAECGLGEYNEAGVCIQCELGLYQDQVGQYSCKPCSRDKITKFLGSSSLDDCKEACEEGRELHSNGSCIPCPIGTYRQLGSNQTCVSCPVGIITRDTGSISPSHCVIPACEVGHYRDTVGGEPGVCEKCPRMTYQDRKWQTECEPCGQSYRTDQDGSSNKADCKFYCSDGEEVTGQALCTKCIPGTFRNNTNNGYFSPCASCADQLLTPSEGAINEADCSLRNCTPGHHSNSDLTACMQCDLGHYQPEQYQKFCFECDPGKSTEQNASISASQCLKYCPSGEEKAVGGACEKCERGYYKDNGDGLFSECTRCASVTYITVDTGAVSADNCTVANCSAGHKLTLLNTCAACEKGTYQSEKWKMKCETCGVNETTLTTAATSMDECMLSCTVGFENRSGVCEPCHEAFYKDNVGAEACTACPVGNRTGTVGAKAEAECDVNACNPGQYGTHCKPCALGEYQPLKWNDLCIECQPGLSTVSLGSNSSADCVKYCPSGEEKAVGGACEKCERGYYKDNGDGLFSECTRCASVTNITVDTGAVSADNCTVANCSAGYKLTMQNTCEVCGKGKYQPMKWETTCIPCGVNETTLSTTATSFKDCMLSCTVGYENWSGVCGPCREAFYKDKVGVEACTACPVGNRTGTVGAKAEAECDVKACEPGEFGVNCDPCDYDYYQPNKWQDTCLLCGAGLTTLITHANSSDDCVTDCDEGKQYTVATETCDSCSRDLYRDKSTKLQVQCVPCPPGKVATTVGAQSQDQCDMDACEPGTYWNGQACVSCVKGTYQSARWAFTCVGCVDGKTTWVVNATSESQCLRTCSVGKGDSNGVCVPCRRGTYKDNDEARPCVDCPAGLTTTGTGAKHTDRCDFLTCDPGSFFKRPTNSCVPCDYGWYQHQQSESQCIRCPHGTTTFMKGVASKSQCVLLCDGGDYIKSGSCSPCPRGHYSPHRNKLTQCKTCGTVFTTAIGAKAQSSNDCIIRLCHPGYYRTILNICAPCDYGQYKSERIGDACKNCPARMVTLQKVSRNVSYCVENCDKGYQYIVSQSSCEKCPIGYYRDKAELSQVACVRCPIKYITTVSGSTSPYYCNIVNCTKEGQYLDTKSESCTNCSRGTYQNEKWMTSCNLCPNGQTTRDNASRHVSECISYCDLNWCMNGAVCQRDGDPSYCVCPNRYSGEKCEIFEAATGRDETLVIVGSSIGAGLFILVVIIVTVAIIVNCRNVKKKENRERQAYEEEVLDSYYHQTPVVNKAYSAMSGTPSMKSRHSSRAPSLHHYPYVTYRNDHFMDDDDAIFEKSMSI